MVPVGNIDTPWVDMGNNRFYLWSNGAWQVFFEAGIDKFTHCGLYLCKFGTCQISDILDRCLIKGGDC